MVKIRVFSNGDSHMKKMEINYAFLTMKILKKKKTKKMMTKLKLKTKIKAKL